MRAGICQCPNCGESFSGETTFVSHRVPGKVTSRPGEYFLGECRDPATKGMRLNARGVWCAPAHPDSGTVEPSQDGSTAGYLTEPPEGLTGALIGVA